jgi:Outer membrane protein beta-barrel domain
MLVLVFAALPGAAIAQTGRKLEVSGFVGGMSLNQDLGSASNIYMSVTGSAESVSFGKLFGFGASWAFTPNIAAEFRFFRATNAYSLSVDDETIGNVSLPEQFEAEQISYTGGVVFQYPTESGLIPYGSFGVGQLRTTPTNAIEGLDSVTGTDLSFGGGVKYWIPSVPWLGVGFDLRYHTATDGLTFAEGDDSPRGTAYTVVGMVRLF